MAVSTAEVLTPYRRARSYMVSPLRTVCRTYPVRYGRSAAQVSGPAIPSGSSPARRWKETTALRVRGPKIPSLASS